MIDRFPMRISSGGALARYVIAAALARTADGGAVVAIVLLVTMQGGSGSLAGLLAACITAPHMLGPFVARRIDLADDGRKVIATACGIYSIALAIAVASYTHVHPLVTGVLLAVAGCCGPLLTGGISSRLAAIVGGDQRVQRRAQGWDVATYGIGGTVGPSIVAAVSVWLSPGQAALYLAAAAFCAAWLVMQLPFTAPDHGGDKQSVPGAWHTVLLIGRDGRLRRTLYMTMLVAFSMASLPITAVHMTQILGISAASAAALTAAYGIGNLSGSIGVMVRPLRGSPDVLMSRLGFCILLGLGGVMLSKSFSWSVAAYWLAGTLNAFFFAATLAARTEYAPSKGKGQVFLWVAAMKITSGSAGTAVAGVLTGFSVYVPLMLGLTMVGGGVLLSCGERKLNHYLGLSSKGSLPHRDP